MGMIPYSQFQADVLAVYHYPLRAKATYLQMRQVLREFGALPLACVTDITPAAIARWLQAYPDRTPIRASSLLKTFRAATRYAQSMGWLDRDPFAFRSPAKWVRVELAPPGPRIARSITAADVQRILDQADKEAATGDWEAARLQALVYLYAFTGMRKSEALHLLKTEIDLMPGILSIRPKPSWRPKTAASIARLPIAEPLAAVLRLWLPRTGSDWVIPGKRGKAPWTGGLPGSKPLDQVKALGERAGVAGVTILGFRKTVATLAKGWGLGQLELKALLRHSNVRTQEWYLEEDLDGLRATAAKIHYR